MALLPFIRTLGVGMRGYDVDAAKRAVYRYLDDGQKWKGYMAQSAVSKRTFGPWFARDVKIAQRKLGLKQDGDFGQQTLRALEKRDAFDAIARRLWVQQHPARCQPIPAGINYEIVGYPNQGTHRAADWQSRNALDWHAPAGTPILAPITGRVWNVGGSNGIRYVGNKIIFGRKLTLIPPAGARSWLGHLANLQVVEGELVRAGDVLGVIGDYGPGSHLHCALEYGNPEAMLDWPRVALEV